MAIDRRELLAGLLSGLCVTGGAHAECLRQRLFVSCRLDGHANASVACFDAEGREVFATSLPARGHDLTQRPGGGEVVVFARRPGDWYAVVDQQSGRLLTVVHAPEGRHLYGHGVFTADGRLLQVTENDIATGNGVIGIYDATDGYRRIGEWSSGGIGPHDIMLYADGRTLAVANGGLRTHPETGREVLNPGDMKPNLAFIDLLTGDLLARQELDASLALLSLRHLAMRSDGTLAFGCQYQGSMDDEPPLLGVVSPGGAVNLLGIESDVLYGMKNYIGSVAFDDQGDYLIATSPRGGAVLVWDMVRGCLNRRIAMYDVCGAAAVGQGAFLLSSGNAGVKALDAGGRLGSAHASEWIWDNHMERIVPADETSNPACR